MDRAVLEPYSAFSGRKHCQSCGNCQNGEHVFSQFFLVAGDECGGCVEQGQGEKVQTDKYKNCVEQKGVHFDQPGNCG